MSFGFGFALPHWQTLSGGFTPASLFAAGEQGAWYDPSDLSTLFTDSAGTTPVTAVEQAVGLMLDKSKGLALGSELITGAFVNGVAFPWPSFSASGTGFTASVTGVFNIYQVANPNGISIVNGRWYKVSVNITQSTDDAVSVSFQNSSTGGGIAQSTTYTFGPTTASTITFYLQATSTSTAYLQFSQQGTTITFNVASVTVKELPGNHAYQSTSTSRPVLRARYNLLTYSEQFDNAAWFASGVAVAANQTAAPDGTTTADRLTVSAGSSTKLIRPTAFPSVAATNSLTGSVYLKAGTHNFWSAAVTNTTTGNIFAVATVDLSTGLVTKTGTGAGGGTIIGTPTLQSVGNGWYRLTITASYPSGTAASLWVFANSSATPTYNAADYGAETWSAAGTETGFVWGAQLIVTNSLLSNTYQRIAAATDYNSSGFLPYLAFDGTDDSMLTNSVDFSATDKVTVWAGLRKLSTSTQIPVELSADVNTNNGAFGVGTDSAGVEYFASSRGTALRQVLADNAAYTSPVTNVLQMSGNISGPSVSARINAVDISTNIGSQGTGNYGNYPLYIGRPTFPFNGNLYSLIIRGAQSSAAQISSTETWVNGKTAAY